MEKIEQYFLHAILKHKVICEEDVFQMFQMIHDTFRKRTARLSFVFSSCSTISIARLTALEPLREIVSGMNRPLRDYGFEIIRTFDDDSRKNLYIMVIMALFFGIVVSFVYRLIIKMIPFLN